MKLRTPIGITLKTATGTHDLPPGGIFKPRGSANIINLLAEGSFEAVLDEDNSNAGEILELAANFRNKNIPLKIYSHFFKEIFFCASTWVSFNSGIKKEGVLIYNFEELEILLTAKKEEQKFLHEAKRIFGGKILSVKEGGGALGGK
mgnify:CR=1 FL=1|tara:strand:+ start:115 stop:555 length:441 start_codon:yes stop_codon:yes gene_type:complete